MIKMMNLVFEGFPNSKGRLVIKKLIYKMIIQSMFLTYLIELLCSLKMINAGSIIIKLKSAVKLGFLLSPFPFFFEQIAQWTIDNNEYISFVLIAISIDHILGTLKHLTIGDFSIKRNLIGLMTKIGLVVACGLLFEGLNSIVTHETLVKDYLTITTRLIVFLYPAGSAFGNSTFLSNGKFPPQIWLDKLQRFQTTLNANEFKSNKHDQVDQNVDQNDHVKKWDEPIDKNEP